jgi:predicted exporter
LIFAPAEVLFARRGPFVLSACQSEAAPQGEEAYSQALVAVRKGQGLLAGSQDNYRLVPDLKKVAENGPLAHNREKPLAFILDTFLLFGMARVW